MLIPSFDASQAQGKHLPGEAGIWIFVLGDMLLFSSFFVTYLIYREAEVLLYSESQLALNKNFGAINTLLLLLSSWFVAISVKQFRTRDFISSSRLIMAAMLCGIGFATIKIIEFSEKFQKGITPLTNDFFMFYFMLTGIHFVHLLIGLGVLSFCWFVIRRESRDSDVSTLESGATFWHMVDLLWIVLFPLLYLLK